MHRLTLTLLALLAAVAATADDGAPNRAAGSYPGDPREWRAPRLVRDSLHRNLALHRLATASSSIDENLTAQLATDGIMPAPTGGAAGRLLTVSTNRGADRSRDRLKSIDGNTVSSYYIYGEEAYIQYDWTGMAIRLDTLRLLTETAFDPATATRGHAVSVEASDDGTAWRTVGTLRGEGLPGYVTQQTVSSDPNKQGDVTTLPLCRGMMEIPLHTGGAPVSHLRLTFRMAGAVWWRLYEVDGGALTARPGRFMVFDAPWRQANMGWLPSAHFCSAWVSDPAATAAGPQWLTIDLGAVCAVDGVRVHWTHPPREGFVEGFASRPGKGGARRPAAEADRLKGHFRYIRLWLTQPGEAGVYGVGEVEVMGRGGLHAEAAPERAFCGGWAAIGDWQLRRAGDSQWLPATVPGTVLTSYINLGAVPETTFGDNMRQVSEAFFNSDFEYRATVRLARAGGEGERLLLGFDGANWRASVTLNGHAVGRIDGAFTRALFDITPFAHPGDNELRVWVEKNAHPGAVKYKNATSTDLNGGVLGADSPTFHPTIGWDWITSTPGRCMGLWGDVTLTADHGLRLADPVVTTTLATPDTLATLRPAVVVTNATDRTRHVTLRGWVGPVAVERPLALPPHSEREACFSPDSFPQLRDRRLALWWPNGYGDPTLHEAGFALVEDGRTRFTLPFRAGLREVAYRDMGDTLTLYVNGKRIDPLGGNWGFPEANLRYGAREFDAAVRYHREMHFNMIRNWVGQTVAEPFYDACDRYGILLWQDFWLANPWDGPDPYDEPMFLGNARDLVGRIRRHPSVAIYCGRNEGHPPATLDSALRRLVAARHPGLGYVPSSADGGVSGHGPYGLMPTEWYFAHAGGKLHTEEGMPCIPTWESLRLMLPADSLWPQGEAWGQHDFTREGAQRGEAFNEHMRRLPAHADGARDYTAWAQWLNYEGHRAMFESRQQDRRGLLMWMSHPCWPSMTWQTYDYYLEPTAAYFGIRKACEPLHVQLNPARRSVEVVNVSIDGAPRLEAVATYFDVRGRRVGRQSASVAPGRDETVEAMPLNRPRGAFFARLLLLESDSAVSDNFYVLGDDGGDLKPLAAVLGEAGEAHGEGAAGGEHRADGLALTQRFTRAGGEWRGTATVANTGARPALYVRLVLCDGDGERVLPVIYSDNYLSLMPGERRTVTVSCRAADVHTPTAPRLRLAPLPTRAGRGGGGR